MLKEEFQDRICRVGPGTPMGDVFRRYWIPVCLSEEIAEPDGAPLRLRILGENLLAFRDTSGRVGLIDLYCAHRRAPLFWGRNEECGIRCVYHGWKFDADGQCVDMPNEPPESSFREKVAITAYPTWEGAGTVWAYMGPPEERPPVPDYEWLRCPPSHVFMSKTFERANWLQALEGGIDTSHSSFAHNNDITDKTSLRAKATAPKLEVEKTPYGYRYVGIRDLKERGLFVRAYQFLMPAQQMRAAMLRWTDGQLEEHASVAGHLWIPIDDEHVWVFNYIYSMDPEKPLTQEFVLFHETKFGRGPEDMLPDYHLVRNPQNDYLIDRQVQKTRTFTGISGINTQDYALQETMEWPWTDRTLERIGTADAAIIMARRLLVDATYDVENGRRPKGVDPEPYRGVRAAERIIARDASWRNAMREDLAARY